MARLHEHQGKALLREHGIAVPRGRVARTPEEARQAALALGGPLVLKVQAWVTARKARGGVVFVDGGPGAGEECAARARELLAMRFGLFPVTEMLVEQRLEIDQELFVSLTVDDAARAAVLLLDARGGSGIEDRAGGVAKIAVTAGGEVDLERVRGYLKTTAIDPARHEALAGVLAAIVHLARAVEARGLEVNPLVVTTDGRVVAADCRMTIDDYAVFRHPELGIEIARELDHPATALERAAYRVEVEDHRGTFYFAQLPRGEAAPARGLIGFHGAGGGGSMMSMDAVSNEGFILANFCDTSGNPSAAKVYRAARIILAQPGLMGYFGSGSGVASQEQFHSAYGLAKAFIELQLSVPAVIRLGGNSEDRAVEILEDACRDLPGTVEGYRKDDTPAFCARRFAELLDRAAAGVAAVSSRRPMTPPMTRVVPPFVGAAGARSFPITGGTVWIDLEHADEAAAPLLIEHSSGLLGPDAEGRPGPAAGSEALAGKDSELIACEIECRRAGRPVLFVDLPVPGLDDS